MYTSKNPFAPILQLTQPSDPTENRSMTWRHVASVKDMKYVAKEVSKKTTVNDIAVAMVTHAIREQLADHALKLGGAVCVEVPEMVNVTIPVHLNGGVLRSGEQLGNKIGGFVSTVPLDKSKNIKSRDRLQDITKILHKEKNLPAPLISWALVSLFNNFAPEWLQKWAMKEFNANSCAVVSNVRGFPFEVHWLGRKVKFISAFLPLPPGIPIGVMLQSYNGNISFSLSTDKKVVPDDDQFAGWMIEEYERIFNGM